MGIITPNPEHHHLRMWFHHAFSREPWPQISKLIILFLIVVLIYFILQLILFVFVLLTLLFSFSLLSSAWCNLVLTWAF